MSSRDRFSGSSTGPITGPGFLDQYAGHIDTFYRAVTLPLTAAAGANAVTATLDPPLSPEGLLDGMRFGITWPASNTAGMSLSINGGPALPVLDANGLVLPGGSVSAGLRSTLEHVAGAFRVQSPLLGADAASGASYFWRFTASGTWTKPAGLDEDRMVTIEAWGGGGGGSSSSVGGGGGGGGYSRQTYRLGDLPSSISIGIGAGGAVASTGATGGSTTVGTLLTAFGGAGAAGGAGGGGAGSHGSGSGSNGGSVGGGDGGSSSSSSAVTGKAPVTLWGGAGGGGYYNPPPPATGSIGGSGASAILGGAGGGGAGKGGGTSIFGGNGGGTGQAGSAPGGGGGRNAAGARGEVRVWA